MFALVNTSARLIRTPDSHLWSPDHVLAYPFWTRYLDVYEGIFLFVRSSPQDSPPSGWQRVTGKGVQGLILDDFHTPLELVSKLPHLHKAARSALQHPWAIHLRAPCMVGEALFHLLPKARPFGIEVGGNPAEAFPSPSLLHPQPLFYRWWFSSQLQRQCASASAAAYVTKSTLQKTYPPHPDAFTTHFSSIVLREDAFSSQPRSWAAPPSPPTLIAVGSLDQPYKGIHHLLDALARLASSGLSCRLIVVGGGRLLPSLQLQASRLGLSSSVHFTGQIKQADEIRRLLRQADLFVMPSISEGLPKAMIEAMAQGLPCIGSAIGGIPELLPPSLLFPPAQDQPLAQKIAEIAKNPGLLSHLSSENLHKARDFHFDVLQKRRNLFYSYTKDKTSSWLQSKPRSFVLFGF